MTDLALVSHNRTWLFPFSAYTDIIDSLEFIVSNMKNRITKRTRRNQYHQSDSLDSILVQQKLQWPVSERVWRSRDVADRLAWWPKQRERNERKKWRENGRTRRNECGGRGRKQGYSNEGECARWDRKQRMRWRESKWKGRTGFRWGEQKQR